MALTEEERGLVSAEIQRFWSRRKQPCAIVKDDLAAAIAAVDGALDGALATINAAIPQPARGALTTLAKLHIVAAALRARAGDPPVS